MKPRTECHVVDSCQWARFLSERFWKRFGSSLCCLELLGVAACVSRTTTGAYPNRWPGLDTWRQTFQCRYPMIKKRSGRRRQREREKSAQLPFGKTTAFKTPNERSCKGAESCFRFSLLHSSEWKFEGKRLSHCLSYLCA